jgi:hypothetical protein
MVRDMATFSLGSQLDVDSQLVRDALKARLIDEEDERWYPAAEAAVGLAVRGDMSVLPAVRDRLKPSVGKLWLEAAAALGHPDLLPSLMALTSEDDDISDPWVSALHRAIGRCAENT